MPIPLIAVAIGAGVVRGAIGAFRARGEAKRKRGLIHEAYNNSSKRLDSRQSSIRQSHEESLAARGMTQGGDAANNVAGGARGELEGEFGLEKQDLDFQRKAALSDVKSQGQADSINALGAGIGTAASVYSMGKDLQARSAIKDAMLGDSINSMAGGAIPDVSQIGGGVQPPKLSPIAKAMTGVEDASNWWGGINGLDPLGASGSSWNRGSKNGGTMLGGGQTNAEFNV